jgi:hypothetical protein
MMKSYNITDVLREAKASIPSEYQQALQGHFTELISMIRRRCCGGCGEWLSQCDCDGRSI